MLIGKINRHLENKAGWRMGAIPLFIWITIALLGLIAGGIHFINQIENSTGFYVLLGTAAFITACIAFRKVDYRGY